MTTNVSTRITPRALAFAVLSPLLIATALAGASMPAAASTSLTASDYCVIVYPVYVGNTQVFGGGTYCVPLP